MYLDVLREQFGKPSGLIGSAFMGPLLNMANGWLISAAIDLLEVRPADKVLDIGFGGGYSVLALAEKVSQGRVVGVDRSPEMVQEAARLIVIRQLQPRARVQCGDVLDLSFRAGSFDRALTANSIYYWPSLAGGLREIARVLKRHGRLAVAFRSPSRLRLLTYGWDGISLYEPEQVSAAMAEAGFKVLRVEQRDRWLPLDTVVALGEKRPAARR